MQAGRLKRLVKQLGETLPADRMLSIYVFNDVFEPGFPPLLSLCNPGRTASELIGNPRRDYLRWVEKFGRPLDEALSVLTQPAKGNLSPIVEAVGDVASRPETRVREGDKSLVLVSDMLQNSSQFTFFGSAPGARDPERLKRLIGKVWQDSMPAAGSCRSIRSRASTSLSGWNKPAPCGSRRCAAPASPSCGNASRARRPPCDRPCARPPSGGR